jgi:hypothetical protein
MEDTTGNSAKNHYGGCISKEASLVHKRTELECWTINSVWTSPPLKWQKLLRLNRCKICNLQDRTNCFWLFTFQYSSLNIEENSTGPKSLQKLYCWGLKNDTQSEGLKAAKKQFLSASYPHFLRRQATEIGIPLKSGLQKPEPFSSKLAIKPQYITLTFPHLLCKNWPLQWGPASYLREMLQLRSQEESRQTGFAGFPHRFYLH